MKLKNSNENKFGLPVHSLFVSDHLKNWTRGFDHWRFKINNKTLVDNYSGMVSMHMIIDWNHKI